VTFQARLLRITSAQPDIRPQLGKFAGLPGPFYECIGVPELTESGEQV
jgi:hypothetical protein